LYGENYLESPWFEYHFRRDSATSQFKHCQPDGILFVPDSNKIVIVEIKRTHCIDAYYQLFELYLPVVKKHYGPNHQYYGLEIVRWFDPDVRLPTHPMLCPDETKPFKDQLSVKIWKPSERK
jgi:hypothetical protein